MIEDVIARKYRDTGKRATRNFFLYIPRKNGKTFLISSLVVWFLLGEKKAGHEIISAAATRDQASLVFDNLCQMIKCDKWLRKHLRIYKATKTIVCDKYSSVFKSVSAEAHSKHGLNPSIVIEDELSQWESKELHQVLTSGSGTREEPLFIGMTTAWKYDKNNIGFECYDYSKRNLDDHTWVSHIYEYTGEDIYNPENWYKANPALGTFLKIDEMEALARRAKLFPSDLNTFLMAHLNQWVANVDKWLSPEVYQPCLKPVAWEDFTEATYLGVDFASVSDMTAACWLCKVDDRYKAKFQFWVPEETAKHRNDRDKIPYQEWIRDGYVQITNGNICDYQLVRKDINDKREEISIKSLMYDQHNATQIITELTEHDGLEAIKVPQTYNGLNQAIKHLEALLLEKSIDIDDSPVIEWMLGSTVVSKSPEGYLKVHRGKSTEKIDGVVALLNAIAGSLVNGWGETYRGGILDY